MIPVSVVKYLLLFTTFQAVERETLEGKADALLPHGAVVAQLVEALCYKPEGRGFDSGWCHWKFSLT
jgi:hypothetical protein